MPANVACYEVDSPYLAIADEVRAPAADGWRRRSESGNFDFPAFLAGLAVENVEVLIGFDVHLRTDDDGCPCIVGGFIEHPSFLPVRDGVDGTGIRADEDGPVGALRTSASVSS